LIQKKFWRPFSGRSAAREKLFRAPRAQKKFPKGFTPSGNFFAHVFFS